MARVLPDSWRERLGDSALASMAEQRNRCTAPSGTAALDKLIGRLSDAAGPGQTFKVVVVDWELLNAFAVPGNKILLTKELIEKADGPKKSRACWPTRWATASRCILKPASSEP